MTYFFDTFRIPPGYFSTAVDSTGGLVATAFGTEEDLTRRVAACNLIPKFRRGIVYPLLQRSFMRSAGRADFVPPLPRRATPNHEVQLINDAAPGRHVREQVLAYWAGDRRNFALPLAPRGTAFQQRVWAALRRIPFAETRSYGQLATELGNPAASRAVGRANATNPICLIVPCHRVIGANGSLTGFAFGEEIKRQLIEHERNIAARSRAA